MIKNNHKIEFVLEKLINKYNIFINKNKTTIMYEVTEEYNLDFELLMSIFLIETHFRPFYKRILEYLFFLISYMVNFLVKKPIPNFTLGEFQIGITSILFYRNLKKCKIHDRKIAKLDFHETIKILSDCRFENNLRLSCEIISSIKFNIEKKWGKKESNIGRIGEVYNGSISYGVLLLKLYKEIKKKNCTTNKSGDRLYEQN
jgi:hypothetical protein